MAKINWNDEFTPENHIDLILMKIEFNKPFSSSEVSGRRNEIGVIEKMISLNIIEKLGYDKYILTDYGSNIKREGGYENLIKSKENKNLKELAEIENLKSQTKLNHYQYNTRYIAIASLLIALAAIVISILDLNKK